MNIQEPVLKNDEKIVFRLRALYRSLGYTQYKMSKFEEYDLYAGNKDFLVSDNVITFTDTNGRLMALKPDVTLSIIKNSQDGPGVQKVFYSENVYRVSGSSRSYREIMQTGLECMGNIDDYAITEVLMLAVKSLERISPDFVLDISHLDIVAAAIDALGVNETLRAALLVAVGEKNLHGIDELMTKAGLSAQLAEPLRRLVTLQGAPDRVLPALHGLVSDEKALQAVERLERIIQALTAWGCGDKVRIDFSVINDMNYYNGIVFKGFVNGVPAGVLSGGQYDRLMRKMGKRADAIGFAVYLDLLERLCEETPLFDVDTVLLYDETTELQALTKAVETLSATGESVTAQRVVPPKMRYRRLVRLTKGEVEILEEHA
ncbi:MAG: ATP phosphoribosyltransferase regulatory subunit [Clostridia bacterium]|nr:ATP phosphoribosyltransferase regulatory subunit [Clostridia bacterium]